MKDMNLHIQEAPQTSIGKIQRIPHQDALYSNW